jgi:hypothetical protein
MYTRKASWNPRYSTLEPDQPRHDRPAVCVIAEQYFSATFALFSFHSLKEKFGACLKNVALSMLPQILTVSGIS